MTLTSLSAKLLRLGALCGLAVSLSTGLFAQEATTAAPEDTQNIEEYEHGSWKLFCRLPKKDGEKKLCKMVQGVVNEKNGTQLMQIEITYIESKPRIAFVMPLGVFLPAGSLLKVDENEPVQLVYQYCDNNACYIGGPLDEKLKELFKSGEKGTMGIRFVNNPEKVIELPVSFKGFTAGFKDLQEKTPVQ